MEFTKESLDREFPSRTESIQFNHAAVCPLPARSAAALGAYAGRLTRRGGLDWHSWLEEADEVRRLAATFIGAGPDVGGADSVSIVPNTTWGLGLVASGLDWRPGDVVVTTDSEFPANLAPWVSLERLGVRVHRVPTRNGAFSGQEIQRACDENPTTRLLSLSAVAFHTGFRAPVEEIGPMCRARGIAFGLDAIQAVGAIPVDVTSTCVDFLSADGHKWMLGPEGCGILFTTPSFRARLKAPPGWTNLKRAHTTDYRVPEHPEYVEDARKFEVGALPTPGVYALAESLRLLGEIGIDVVRQRIAKILSVLVEGLPRLGFSPVLFGGPPAAGILAARPPEGRDARYYSSRLARSGIVISAREGFVRFSPHVGNDEGEAERILEGLESLATA